MSAEANVLSVAASVMLSPGQSAKFPTLNGTTMTLILNNLSTSNNCGYAVSSNVLNDAGTLQPTGQKAYPPTDYKGGPITVSNTTPPGTPALLQVNLL